MAIPGFRLSFDKKGQDGSGKATLTAKEHAVAYGAVFEIDMESKTALDSIEGDGYELMRLQIRSNGHVESAYAYLAKPGQINPELRPFGWYHALVVAGVRYWQFPQAYITDVLAVDRIADPCRERNEKHQRLLGEMDTNYTFRSHPAVT